MNTRHKEPKTPQKLFIGLVKEYDEHRIRINKKFFQQLESVNMDGYEKEKTNLWSRGRVIDDQILSSRAFNAVSRGKRLMLSRRD